MANTYHLCDSCSAGVSNDDWTHLDADCCCNTAKNNGHDEDCEAERAHVGILATLELVGWLTHSHKEDGFGYFDCYLCSDIQCGSPHVWLGEK